MPQLQTWLFDGHYAVKQYQQNKQSIDTKLKTVYQQAQYLMSAPTDNKVPFAHLKFLQLNPFEIDIIIQQLKSSHWYPMSVTWMNYIDLKNHQKSIDQLSYQFNRESLHGYETLVSQFNNIANQIMNLTFKNPNLSKSEITIYHNGLVEYKYLSLKKFRHLWTIAVNAIQHQQRQTEIRYYPLIISQQNYLPDFDLYVHQNKALKKIRRNAQQLIYQNYTVDTLPKPSRIIDQYLHNGQQGDYIIIRQSKFPQKAG